MLVFMFLLANTNLRRLNRLVVVLTFDTSKKYLNDKKLWLPQKICDFNIYLLGILRRLFDK